MTVEWMNFNGDLIYQTDFSRSQNAHHILLKNKKRKERSFRWLKVLCPQLFYIIIFNFIAGLLAINGFLWWEYLTFRRIKTFAEIIKERFSWKSQKKNVFPITLYDYRNRSFDRTTNVINIRGIAIRTVLL